METTEHVLRLSRQLEEKLEEARAIVSRIVDAPVRMRDSGRQSIYRELLAAGMNDDEAWSTCGKLIAQRQCLVNIVNDLRAETELLTMMADDVIGVNGRLV